MKVKKLKKRIEMSLELLEESEEDISYIKKTLIAAYQKIEQQQEEIAELESENKSLNKRIEIYKVDEERSGYMTVERE